MATKPLMILGRMALPLIALCYPSCSQGRPPEHSCENVAYYEVDIQREDHAPFASSTVTVSIHKDAGGDVTVVCDSARLASSTPTQTACDVPVGVGQAQASGENDKIQLIVVDLSDRPTFVEINVVAKSGLVLGHQMFSAPYPADGGPHCTPPTLTVTLPVSVGAPT